MNGKIQVDINVLRILYYKYREYLLPIIIFLVAWGSFFQFVLPQLQNFFTEKDQIVANEQTLATLSQNYNSIISFNETSLDQLLNTATQALPSTKDFAGILTAISNAAGIAGVTVNDYSFNVGDLNTVTHSSAKEQTITISLTIDGDLNQSKQFIKALNNQLPLSQVSSLTVTGSHSTAISADFYYDPLPVFPLNLTTSLPVISVAQKQLLQNLSNTQTASPMEVSSSSAQIIPKAAMPSVSAKASSLSAY